MIPVGLEVAKAKLKVEIAKILTQPTPDPEGGSDVIPKRPDEIASEITDAIYNFVKSAQIVGVVCPPPSGVQAPGTGFLQ